MLRFAPPLAILVLLGPLAFGLLSTTLPAFGYLPSLGSHTFTTQIFSDLFTTSGFYRSVCLSLMVGLITPLVSLCIVMSFLSGWLGTRVFRPVQNLISPLLALPHAAAAFGLAFLIMPSGFILRLFSPWATGSVRPPDLFIVNDPYCLSMMAGLIIKEIPFLLLVSLAALPQIERHRSFMITQSFGYGRMMGFFLTTCPLIYRQIRLAVFAVIAYAGSVVDVAIVLGPSTPSTLSVRLVQWMNDPELSFRFLASSGALIQFAIIVFSILVWLVVERIASSLLRFHVRRGTRFRSDKIIRSLFLFLIVFCATLIFSGMLLLAIWSFASFWSFPDIFPRSFTFSNWHRSLPSLTIALSNTIISGILATLLATLITLACLEREARTNKTGDTKSLILIYLPLLVPQVSFVFGLQIFFLSLNIDATMPSLIFVHLIFVLPYVFLSLSGPWRAWDTRYRSIAFGFGTSPTKVFFRLRLPMLLKPILIAMSVGFAVSVSQYLPTLLIGAGRLPSITTEAVALASGGNARTIGVYAFLQMLLPFLAFSLSLLLPTILYRNRSGMDQQ